MQALKLIPQSLFSRFGFSVRDLGRLNFWRNVVAHHNVVPPGGLPSQADLQRWRNSCDGLATSVDGIMYNELQKILATAPWVPSGGGDLWQG